MYIVVRGSNLQSLIDEVNELLGQGFVCEGGVVCRNTEYLQAMSTTPKLRPKPGKPKLKAYSQE